MCEFVREYLSLHVDGGFMAYLLYCAYLGSVQTSGLCWQENTRASLEY